MANYGGYAFVECTAANKPAVRLVLMQGVVPRTFRERAAYVANGDPAGQSDSIAGKVTMSKDRPVLARWCRPVVGACVK